MHRRIYVSDFDSVHQASDWRRLGAAQATNRLISVLRTAILLGDELVIDRNQLFDGIFFLSLRPEGVAAALGYDSSAKLPIVVKCQPLKEDPVDLAVPVLRGAEQEQISVDYQLEQVRKDKFRQTSSALMATLSEDVPNSWLCDAPGSDWVEGAGLSRFVQPISDRNEVLRLLEDAQDAWADAILDGRVAADSWDRNETSAPLDVPAALKEDMKAILNQGVKLTCLGKYVFQHACNRRGTVSSDVRKWVEENPQSADLYEAKIAMEAWSKAYYRAIACRDKGLYLAFFDSTPNDDLARKYGLLLPSRSRYERLQDWLFNENYGNTIRVEGRILDDMSEISSANFAQLYLLTRQPAKALIEKRDSRAMYDLAYAAREAINRTESIQQKRLTVVLRIVWMTIIALLIAVLGLLPDLTALSALSKIIILGVATALGVLSGLPWDDFKEFFSLRKSSLTATLTLTRRR